MKFRASSPAWRRPATGVTFAAVAVTLTCLVVGAAGDAMNCKVGTSVKADYSATYPDEAATVASISGDTVTLNWSDENTHNREKDVSEVKTAGGDACNFAGSKTCNEGDSVRAYYNTSGSYDGWYDATIASISGDTVTVDWSDGAAASRQLDVSKVSPLHFTTCTLPCFCTVKYPSCSSSDNYCYKSSDSSEKTTNPHSCPGTCTNDVQRPDRQMTSTECSCDMDYPICHPTSELCYRFGGGTGYPAEASSTVCADLQGCTHDYAGYSEITLSDAEKTTLNHDADIIAKVESTWESMSKMSMPELTNPTVMVKYLDGTFGSSGAVFPIYADSKTVEMGQAGAVMKKFGHAVDSNGYVFAYYKLAATADGSSFISRRVLYACYKIQYSSSCYWYFTKSYCQTVAESLRIVPNSACPQAAFTIH